ncbi:MAG: hypothetical protein KKE83_03745 [Proteobacteria bacterium]|nr:hypothetical protein [Pseudomonadota bacterium]
MTIVPTSSMQKWLFRGAALLFAATLAALGVYIFCSYRAFFSSDAAIANILAEEIVRAGELFPKNWWYVNDDLWVFYKHLLLIPWVMAGENSFFAHGVSVAVVVLITMAVLALLLRDLGLSKTAALMGCIIIGLGYSPLYLREVYGEAAYTWYFAFIISFLLLWLRADRPDSGKNARRALFGLLLVLLYLVVLENPVRFMIYYVAPFCGAFLLLVYAEREALRRGEYGDWRAALSAKSIPAGAIAGVFVLGVFCYKVLLAEVLHAEGANRALLVPLQELPFHAAYSVLGLLHFIGAEWQDKVELASVEGVVSLLRLGFYPLALVLPAYYAKRNFSRLEQGQRFFVVLSYLGFALIFFLYSVSTLHENAYAARNNIRYIIPYLMMVLVCPVVVWRFFPQIAKAALGVALVLAIVSTWNNISPEGWRETAQSRADLITVLKKRGLVSGYAPYWDSHVYTVLSKGEVSIRPLDIDTRGVGLCLWLSSDRWYEKGYADGKVFFLVPSEKLENWEDGCETLSLPQPVESFPHGNYTVFVFSENPLPGIVEKGRVCREGE